MRQLKNHVGASDHGQGKRGENLMTPCGKQPRNSVFGKEQHNAGEGDDAENQGNQLARAVRNINILHSPLFSAA